MSTVSQLSTVKQKSSTVVTEGKNEDQGLEGEKEKMKGMSQSDRVKCELMI